MKIHCQRKINECFLLTSRMGIKACVRIIFLLGVAWLFGLLSPVHKAFAYIFTIHNSVLRSVFEGNSQNYSIFIIILLSNQVKHHYDGHMIFFWKFKTKMLLTMQEKTDFFFNYMICNFPSLLEILIGTLSNLFAYCKN